MENQNEDFLDYGSYDIKPLATEDEVDASSKKVLYFKSNSVNSDGTPKEPTADELDYGELAINYVSNNERIFIKNDDDKIVPFITKKALMEAPIVSASEVDYYLCLEETTLSRMQIKPIYYKFIASDMGTTTCTIDGEQITINEGETIEGFCDELEDLTYANNLKEIYIIGNTNLHLSAENCSNTSVNIIELTYLDDYVTNMDNMFNGYGSLTSLKVNGCAITSAYQMCNGCNNLVNIDFNDIDFDECVTFYNMFAQCVSLSAIDVANWVTSNATSLGGMFDTCLSLQEIDISNWDVSNVSEMQRTFNHLENVTDIDTHKWVNSKVNDMQQMFNNCILVSALDLSGLDTSNVTDMAYLFANNPTLEEIQLGDNWNMSNVSSVTEMFVGDTSLRTVSGTISNIMVDMDLSDCPLSRLSALVFIEGFYNYHEGETHTCTFSDYTIALLLEEDFQKATEKNWNIGEYVSVVDETGDVVYWGDEQRRMIVIKPDYVAADNYPIDLFTPIGIVAVPSSHDVYGTGAFSMVSLALMDCDNPDEGSLSNDTACCWGYNGLLIGAQEQSCAVTGTTANPTTDLTDVTNISDNHYLPSDLFDVVQCPTDTKAYYSNSSSDFAVPSPYLEDGSSNSAYHTITQTTAVGDVNMLSDFDGIGNTAFILDTVTIDDWKTAKTITNSAESSGNYPAAMCCWRYNTTGTNQGDWYLPAIGELGYLMVRANRINVTIDIINNVHGTVAHKLVSDYTWSSTEYSPSQSVYVDFSNGLIYPMGKADSRDSRAYCHINTLGYNYYFVGGNSDSIVTIDGENITIPAGEEVYGYCYDDISDIPTNNLKEIHIYCDVSLRIGSETEIENYNTTVEIVEIAFSGTFERDFTSLCRGLGALKSIKLTGGIADSVDYMLNWCENLTELDVNNINTRRCTNLEDVFSNCRALANIDLSKWDVSQVTDFRGIFYYCPVTELDVTDWDTSKGENFWGVFDTCNKLTYLDLSGWDTSNAKTFRQLFNGCTVLETLILGDGWDCQGILSDTQADDDNSFYRAFRNCNALTTVQGSIKNIKANLDLSYSPLTRDSALIFINGLSNEVSGHTLTLSSTTKELLTSDDIAIATNKGWTIA